MPSATLNSTTGATATPPSVDAAPEAGRGEVADDHRPLGTRNAAPGEPLRRSAAALTDALDQLSALQSELRAVVDIASRRPWSDDEQQHYWSLTRQEREAHRRTIAIRNWFDDVRAR